MRKILITALVLASSALPLTAHAAPAADNGCGTAHVSYRKYGPYYSYEAAMRAAYQLQCQGYYTRVTYEYGCWYVMAWR
jgi:hypothetical protein